MDFTGFLMDDYHALVPMYSEPCPSDNGWYILTFKNKVEKTDVTYTFHLGDGETFGDTMFAMDKIDPNDFEWNGKRLFINEADAWIKE